MRKYSTLLIALTLAFVQVQAQTASESAYKQLIQQTIDQIYNYEFDQAEANLQKLKASQPHHPAAPMLSALNLYWKNFPMLPSKPAFGQYDAYLQQALDAAEQLMKQPQTRNEGIFFALSVHGYRAMTESDAGNTMGAIRESKKAFGFMKQGFKLKEQYPDFYLTSGLYNFYVEQYPEDHPMVKPVMWFFPDGDKELGLKQMEIATQKGTFTRTEALYYLVFINQKYRAQSAKVLGYSRKLNEMAPNNPLFMTRHAEVLLSCGKYAEAQPVVSRLLQQSDKLFLSSAHIFEGIIQEKQYGNLEKAKACYQKALQLAPYNKKDAVQQAYTREFYALAYAGLGRIAAQEGQNEMARGYYKKSLSVGEYKSTIQEAKAYLSS
jgi:tetratricopeptide (TPR) repeat protein